MTARYTPKAFVPYVDGDTDSIQGACNHIEELLHSNNEHVKDLKAAYAEGDIPFDEQLRADLLAKISYIRVLRYDLEILQRKLKDS